MKSKTIKADIVTASAFNLIDTKGRLRAVLSTDAQVDGDPTLRMCDANERTRIILAVEQMAARFVILNETGTTALSAGCDPGNDIGIGVYDQEGRIVFEISVFPGGARRLLIVDACGKIVFDNAIYRALRNEVKIIDLHFSLVERPEKKLGSGGVCS